MDTPTTQLASQVGGHAGVMTTEDGSLLIKPALPRELQFYQMLQQDAALEALREFTPKFLGTLKLEGKVDPTKPDEREGLVIQPVAVEEKDMCFFSIVLENLSFPFLKPNILDIKLGTVLYDADAPADKVARMEKTARDTTSLETGIRLTGFQVYDNITSQPVNTPKSYGKTIQVHELREGIAKFFPIGAPVTESSETIVSSAGLPHGTLVPILRAIHEEITLIREVYSGLELRMVGGSLLVIYEADWTRAEENIKKHLADDEEEEEDEDAEDDDDDEDESKSPPPFIVKLIDFAHTEFVPGQGPDEGVLLGMDNVLQLLDARLHELLSISSS